MKHINKKRNIALCILVSLTFAIAFSVKTYATTLLTVSPPRQKISLIPGETTYGSFKISSPNRSTGTGTYEITISPFKVDESDNSAVFETNGDYNQIVDWITLDWSKGEIAPNETVEVTFKIETPEDAPAGGQYAAIMVGSVNDYAEEDAVNIQNRFQIAHLLYADVAGETVRGGEINNATLPSFMFSGNITGSSEIKNNGNVHSYAKHVLKVLPLFSNEEFYTNEENPDEVLVMPEATRLTSVSWDQTPRLGIFRAIYTVEFEGVKKELSKIIIICPIWLLFILAAIIVVLIIRIAIGKRHNSKDKSMEQSF